MGNKQVIVYVFFLLAVSITTQTEYIVYKRAKSGKIERLSLEEYKKNIYPVLLKYQWPTSIMFFHEKPGTEIWEYTRRDKRYEQEYIARKLKEVNSSYRIAFIPNLIYELFIMEMDFIILNEKTIIKDEFENLKFPIIGLMRTDVTYKEMMEPFLKLYDNLSVIKAFYSINDELVRYLTRQKFYKHHKRQSLSAVIRAYKYPIAKELLEKLAQRGERVELLLKPQMLRRLIELEYEAHDTNAALIYRGISAIKPVGFGKVVLSPFELPYLLKNFFKAKPMPDFKLASLYRLLDKKRKEEKLDEMEEWELKLYKDEYEKTGKCTLDLEKPARSISYGNNLFSGYYHDKSACIYYYLMEPSEIKKLKAAEVSLEAGKIVEESGFEDSFGYVLFINKWLYAKSYLRDIIRIPPIGPLVGLYAHGEFFHPRTPAYYHGKPGDQVRLPGFNNSFSFVDYPGYIISYSDQLKGAKKLADYLTRHSRIIKLFDVEGGYNLKTEVVSRYMQDQKDLLSVLKLLKLTYDQCLKRREHALAQILESLLYQIEELHRVQANLHVQIQAES